MGGRTNLKKGCAEGWTFQSFPPVHGSTVNTKGIRASVLEDHPAPLLRGNGARAGQRAAIMASRVGNEETSNSR
jgi:hypothetical protein